jgi:hypothetical protein
MSNNDQKRLRDPSAARRIAIGFGLGFIFAVAPLVGLGLWFGKQSPWPTWPILVIVGSLALSMLSFLYAFSGLMFFRCPNCKTRIRRQTLVRASPKESGSVSFAPSATSSGTHYGDTVPATNRGSRLKSSRCFPLTEMKGRKP